MAKINKPTDLLIRETALKLIMEVYRAMQMNKPVSGYKIAKKLNLDNPLIYDYLNRWKKQGLLCYSKENQTFYLNPDFFEFRGDSLSFTIDSIVITLEKKDGGVR
ncbi:MAG: hypothetical protein U9Q22_04960 [Candidatus Altiarchaeota archaeon]|nr:hypothetical protein [Candidatus Altiarchaeota archaeon]